MNNLVIRLLLIYGVCIGSVVSSHMNSNPDQNDNKEVVPRESSIISFIQPFYFLPVVLFKLWQDLKHRFQLSRHMEFIQRGFFIVLLIWYVYSIYVAFFNLTCPPEHEECTPYPIEESHGHNARLTGMVNLCVLYPAERCHYDSFQRFAPFFKIPEMSNVAGSTILNHIQLLGAQLVKIGIFNPIALYIFSNPLFFLLMDLFAPLTIQSEQRNPLTIQSDRTINTEIGQPSKFLENSPFDRGLSSLSYEQLRNKYRELYNKFPHGNMKQENLIKRINNWSGK